MDERQKQTQAYMDEAIRNRAFSDNFEGEDNANGEDDFNEYENADGDNKTSILDKVKSISDKIAPSRVYYAIKPAAKDAEGKPMVGATSTASNSITAVVDVAIFGGLAYGCYYFKDQVRDERFQNALMVGMVIFILLAVLRLTKLF